MNTNFPLRFYQGPDRSKPTAMEKQSITIVGAGIGGISLALGLLRAGHAVTVYEQAPELGEVGAGLSISPNASLGLDYLGLGTFMTEYANRPLMQYTHHGLTDENLVAIDRNNVCEEYGAPYYQIHRADFHAELTRQVNALDPNCLKLGKAITNVEQDERTITLTFPDNTTVEVEILIGADGVKSVVRDSVFGDCAPEFTGYMAWRGLVPSDRLGGFYNAQESHVWVGEGKNVVTYPIRGSSLVNVVVFAKAATWEDEGWSIKADPADIARIFDGWHEKPLDAIDALPAETCYRWGLFARQPLANLVNGRVALIGDAAHPMLPFFGQGASSSIEDAVVLCRCLDASETLDETLSRYNSARLGRVTTLQRESNLGGERLQGLDPYILRDQPLKNEDALGIFRYNPTQVAV